MLLHNINSLNFLNGPQMCLFDSRQVLTCFLCIWTRPNFRLQPLTDCVSPSDVCEDLCSERLRVSLALAAAAVLFPLLVWGGYALLPFDSPRLDGPALRLVYALRCAFFATIPIVLGNVP